MSWLAGNVSVYCNILPNEYLVKNMDFLLNLIMHSKIYGINIYKLRTMRGKIKNKCTIDNQIITVT